MKRSENSFKVLNWDHNTDRPIWTDVMPYLRDEWKACKPKDRPKLSDLSSVKEWAKHRLMRRYWSRCEYETLVSGWPKGDNVEKIDVWSHVEKNFDLVVRLFVEDVSAMKKASSRKKKPESKPLTLIVEWRFADKTREAMEKRGYKLSSSTPHGEDSVKMEFTKEADNCVKEDCKSADEKPVTNED